MRVPRVLNRHADRGGVWVGRPTKWGNPFSHLENTSAKYKVATREDAVREYEAWIVQQPDLMAALPELEGRDLLCCCVPLACHATVLLRLANPKLFPKAQVVPI